MDADHVLCDNGDDVDSFLSLVLHSQRVRLRNGVQVTGTISAQDWSNLAKACTHLDLDSFVGNRYLMREAERGDLKTIWDGLDIWGEWIVYYKKVGDTIEEIGLEWDTEEEKEKEWGNLQVGIKYFHWQLNVIYWLLQEILDKPPRQWSTSIRKRQNSTSH